MGGKVSYLGELEQVMLLAIVRLGDEAYGGSIRREIESRGGRVVTIGATYATLDRLVDKGYLRAREAAGGDDRGGQPRRCFALTPAGVAALEAARALQVKMWQGVQLPKGRKA